MIYYAKITKQKDKSYLVEFPELDGCLTEGSTIKDAKKNAKEALDGYLIANCDRNLKIPNPIKRKANYYYPIEVDIRIEFAIKLRKLRKKKRLSQAQVAKLLEITQQAYAKLETPLKANPTLSTIKKLSEALEAEIDLQLVA